MEEAYTIPYENNRYCGPAALAYVTRSGPDDAARLLREASGKRSIRGVSNAIFLAALRAAGFTASASMPPRAIRTGQNPTLRQWLVVHQGDPREYIVNVTGHYIVVHGSQYFDNRCHLGKTLDRCPYLNKRVKLAWLVKQAARG